MTMPHYHGKPYAELSSMEIDRAGIRDAWERWWAFEYMRERPTEYDVEPGTDWTKHEPL